MNRHESWGDEEEEGGWQPLPDEHSPLSNTGTGPSAQHRRIQSLDTTPRWGRRNAPHRRYQSTLGDIFASIGQGLETIAEDVKSEARLVRDAFTSELDEADKGKKFFLDMTMSRNMSVLPDQLSQMMDEATGKFGARLEEEALLPTGTTTASPTDNIKPKTVGIYPYLSLLGAVLAVSSSGSAVSLLRGVSPPLKFYWRTTVTAIIFSGFALRVVLQRGLPHLSFSQWLTFLAAAVCWTTSVMLCMYAYNYTSIGNVVIGANSQAIILLIGKVLVGERLHWMEATGVLIAFSGCILCSTDEVKDPDQADSGKLAIFGDLLALGSGFFGVGYLTFAKAVRSNLPVFVFMFLVMLTGSLLGLLFMGLMEHEHLEFSRDPFVGLFGWMNTAEDRVYILLYMAVVVHVVGSAGFVRSMEFFENIVIAVATLLEPITATLIAFSLGVGQLPGTMGWIGNLLVVLGTLGVVYPSVNKGDGAH
eukprot:scaffold793_cov161-Amphora_coffeaeformis.AAC.8